ncbi:MAG: hypothetical protein IPH93_14510 [Saprospiraceae bacterium]|nr:hypothetical protein [Saprospiraceae bacterium]MBK7812598.1 hypothetical protein [Saprospiraceae bacterium]MBK9630789.1 hypothetical protein [Saprospiraceae bacterium]
MEVVEIKSQLLRKIEMIQDEKLLLEALQFLELETEIEYLVLPIEIVDKVEAAKIEKLSGQFVEHTEANKLVNKWLSKQ